MNKDMKRINIAMDNLSIIDPEYKYKMLDQRTAHGKGSVFSDINTVEDMEKAIRNANWVQKDHPNIADDSIGFVTTDIPNGQYGMVSIAEQSDDAVFRVVDNKNTGFVSLVLDGVDRVVAKETWLILCQENGVEIVATFHPGEPIPRATTSTKEIPVETILTKAEALEKGFKLAKVGQTN